MKPNPGKFGSSRLMSSMPPINGKTIVACGLVVMLAFMWIKVFVGSTEQAKEVASVLMIKEAKAAAKVLTMKRVPLVNVSGRHDRLTTDMFAPRATDVGNDTDVSSLDEVVEIKSQKDAAGKLARKIELDAIILGVNSSAHQAFINGRLQIAGDEISIKLSDQIYKIIVMEIFHNKVILKWNEYTISVRMAQLGKVN
jgi:hypothetical protein